MLDKNKKKQIIQKYKTHANDTGSPEIQIAILTEEIKELTEHLKIHRKDYSSRRGLIRKVSLRRKLLKYLEKENLNSFENIVKKLKIKIARRQELEDDAELLFNESGPDETDPEKPAEEKEEA